MWIVVLNIEEMMRMNRKGFMMAEVVVVSAIVLIFLASLYISYNQIYSKYRSRSAYYDSVALYRLSYFRDILIENKKLVDVLEQAKTNKVISVYDTDSAEESLFQLSSDGSAKDRAFIIYNNKQNFSGNELDSLDIHQTFKEYINYLSTSADFTNSDYVMVLERCESEDECKYAYLELYDGIERPNPTAAPSSSSSPSSSSGNPGSSETTTYGEQCHIYNVTGYKKCNGENVEVRQCDGNLVYKWRDCSVFSGWRHLVTCNATCYYYCNNVYRSFPYIEVKLQVPCV